MAVNDLYLWSTVIVIGIYLGYASVVLAYGNGTQGGRDTFGENADGKTDLGVSVGKITGGLISDITKTMNGTNKVSNVVANLSSLVDQLHVRISFRRTNERTKITWWT